MLVRCTYLIEFRLVYVEELICLLQVVLKIRILYLLSTDLKTKSFNFLSETFFYLFEFIHFEIKLSAYEGIRNFSLF